MAKSTTKTPATKETMEPRPQWPSVWGGLESFRDEMDHLFDDFARGIGRVPAIRRMTGAATVPAVDIVEKDKAYEVTAELPGMSEADVDVKVTDHRLTITGEKKEESEKTDKGYHLSERRYGSFMRSFPIPEGVEADKIDAAFKNGVLKVTMPKSADAQKPEKKITVKKG